MSLYVHFLGYNSYKWIKNSKFAQKIYYDINC